MGGVMRVYLARSQWAQTRADGTWGKVSQFVDTRAECRQVARKMAHDASIDSELARRESFDVDVIRCEVSDRFGKGRRFVVALMNREQMITPLEVTDTVSRPPASVRCGGCGSMVIVQDLLTLEALDVKGCHDCFEDDSWRRS